MVDRQTPIYAARTLQDAHLLRNILADAGIESVVTNELLQGGSGVDVVGWATSPRVVVSDTDAGRARQIALDFEQRTGGESQSALEALDSPEPAVRAVAENWPTCPECGVRRSTRCTVCGTAGKDFPPADAGFTDRLGLPLSTSAGPCCGPEGCTDSVGPTCRVGPRTEAGASLPAEPRSEESGVAPPEVPLGKRDLPMLLCPTCDEPFVPEYAARCEWCGHQFADGFQMPDESERAEEGMNPRVAIALAAVIAAVAAGAFYFVYVLR